MKRLIALHGWQKFGVVVLPLRRGENDQVHAVSPVLGLGSALSASLMREPSHELDDFTIQKFRGLLLFSFAENEEIANVEWYNC